MKKRVLYCAIVLFMSCIISGSVFGSETELDTIRDAIAEKGAGWTASDNWIMQMDPSDRKTVLGAPEDSFHVAPGDTILWNNIPEDSFAPPSEFDWRNYNGYNWITPIKNQGNCGSCVAFATVGGMESAIRIHQGNPNQNIDLSEQHLFSCGGGSCVLGWNLGDALNFARDYGVPDESCLPYSGVDNNCTSTCSDYTSRAIHINSWSWITTYTADINAVKNALTQKPIPTRMVVYSDFYSYSGGVYQHVSGYMEGGHLVLIVGWNDAQNCWIVKNSWGLGWGESGYFRIRYNDSEIGTWAALIQLGSAPPSTTVSISMPYTHYYPGYQCYCDVSVNTQTSLNGYPLFVVLDIYGNYFFAPSFVSSRYGYDYYSGVFNPPSSIVEVLPTFYWPYGSGSANNIHFYAAMTNPSQTSLISNLAQFTFGWTSSDPPTGAAVPIHMFLEENK